MRCLEMLLEPVLYTRACADGNYGKSSGSKCKSGGHGSFWRRGKRGDSFKLYLSMVLFCVVNRGGGDTRCYSLLYVILSVQMEDGGYYYCTVSDG